MAPPQMLARASWQRSSLAGRRRRSPAPAAGSARLRPPCSVMVATALVLSSTLTGCKAEPTAQGVPSGQPVSDAGAPEPTELPTPTEVDRAALDELLLSVPTARVATSAPDGGTLVGSETGEPSDGGVVIDWRSVAPPPRPKARLRAGELDVQPGLSTPAMERAARAQFYWPLVQKCRDADGSILPPDSITLRFTIRPDGSVDPASVRADAAEPRFEPAADCMVREFSALPFRASAAAHGGTSRVIATLPSVD